MKSNSSWGWPTSRAQWASEGFGRLPCIISGHLGVTCCTSLRPVCYRLVGGRLLTPEKRFLNRWLLCKDADPGKAHCFVKHTANLWRGILGSQGGNRYRNPPAGSRAPRDPMWRSYGSCEMLPKGRNWCTIYLRVHSIKRDSIWDQERAGTIWRHGTLLPIPPRQPSCRRALCSSVTFTDLQTWRGKDMVRNSPR